MKTLWTAPILTLAIVVSFSILFATMTYIKTATATEVKFQRFGPFVVAQPCEVSASPTLDTAQYIMTDHAAFNNK
jgi:hypothetical protein